MPVRSNSCWRPPRARGVLARRVGEQALLGGARRLRGRLDLRRARLLRGRGLLLALRRLLGRRGGGRGRGGVLGGELELLGDLLGRRRALPRRGVGLRDLRQARVRVGVAVRVLHLDEAAETLGVADAHDLAVVDGDDRGAAAGEDLDPATGLGSLDHKCTVALLARALVEALGLGLGQVVGVGRLGRDWEVPLSEAGQRADEVGGQPADQPRAHEHGVDVPVGVVVGEDRLAQVLLGAGGLEVAGGGEDRVGRVVRVLEVVLVGVDAVLLPGRGHELHPPERARGGHVEVAAVVGLDLVDRRQHLPAHAVLDAGGLVEREEEGRDAELVDEEVRDADRGRAGLGQRERRVVDRGRSVRRAPGGGLGTLLRALRLSCAIAFLELRLPARNFWLRVGAVVVPGTVPVVWLGLPPWFGLGLFAPGFVVALGVGVPVTPGIGGDGRDREVRRGLRRGRGDRAVVDDLHDRARDAGDVDGGDGAAGGHVDGRRDALAGDQDDGDRVQLGRGWDRSKAEANRGHDHRDDPVPSVHLRVRVPPRVIYASCGAFDATSATLPRGPGTSITLPR